MRFEADSRSPEGNDSCGSFTENAAVLSLWTEETGAVTPFTYRNAVDRAQYAHTPLIAVFGGSKSEEALIYRRPFPTGDTLEEHLYR